MPSNRSAGLRNVARSLWLIPLVLGFLVFNQLKVGLDLRHTLVDGERAVATVTDFEKVDRKDVTYGYVSLNIPMSDGSTITREEMPLPYSLLHRVEDKQELGVRVLPGAAQEIVIEIVANAQWKMALIQSAIALIALVMSIVGVYAWNRYLKKYGDPAYRVVPELIE